MNRLSAFIAELQTRVPDDPPYLITAYRIILVVAGFFVAWVILRWLLHFVEKRIGGYEFIQINAQVFQLIRRAMFLALVMVAGTYLVRLTRIPILEKIFHALLIVFLAIPAKNFLVVAGAGVAGVAIGFAAKDTLSNLIAGILLIIDRPFEVGDRIEVWSAPAGTSTWGDVIDIGCTRFHILPTGLKQRLMGRELRSRIRNGIFTLKGRLDEVFVTGY